MDQKPVTTAPPEPCYYEPVEIVKVLDDSAIVKYHVVCDKAFTFDVINRNTGEVIRNIAMSDSPANCFILVTLTKLDLTFTSPAIRYTESKLGFAHDKDPGEE